MHSRAEQKECVQLPGKMATSDPPPNARVTRGAGSGQHLAAVLQEGRENANIDAGLGFVWRISVEETKTVGACDGYANRDYRSLIDALEPPQYPTIIVASEHAMAGPNALEVNRMFSRARAKIVSKLQVALSRCAPSRCAPVYPPDLSWGYFFHQIRSHDIRIRSVFDVGVAAGTPELYSAFPDADLFLFDPTRQAAQHMQKIATERSAVVFNVALGEKNGDRKSTRLNSSHL